MLLVATDLPALSMQADWIEASCLFGKDRYVSRSEASVALESSGSFRDYQINRVIGNAFEEIKRRQSLLKDYPFYLDRNGISRVGTWNDFCAYSFMLLLSINHFYKQTQLNNTNRGKPVKLFEALTTLALNKYFPASINIGWPRDTIPKDFIEALKFFCQISNESIQEKPLLSQSPKDEDVDVISWNPIDTRSGQVILLAQCTIEKDWQRSGAKILITSWEKIVNFATTPSRALAFPQVCDLSQWKYQSGKCGILLDRLRLVSLFKPDETKCVSIKINDWSRQQITNLRWFE